MAGIIMCEFALALTIIAIILFVVKLFMELKTQQIDWPIYIIIALILVPMILIELALLWGNIGIIYSHAGWTG